MGYSLAKRWYWAIVVVRGGETPMILRNQSFREPNFAGS
jgi:hypothetical protein